MVKEMEEKIITFRDGIPGIENLHFFLLVAEGDGVFYSLQSIEEPSIELPLMAPAAILSEYTPHIPKHYFDRLGGGEDSEFTLFIITRIMTPVEKSTLNLQAPILIHIDRRVGIQAITDDVMYKTRHTIEELTKA